MPPSSQLSGRARVQLGRAKEAADVLIDIFEMLDAMDGQQVFVPILAKYPFPILRLFIQDGGLANFVLKFHKAASLVVSQPSDLNETPILANMASLLAGLLEELPGACGDDAPVLAQHLQRRIAERLEKWFARIQPQVAPLTLALVDWHQQILRLRNDGEALVLLEFPIGNSLLTRMLSELLTGSGAPNSIVRLRVSRNEARSKGKTRSEHVREQIHATAPAVPTLYVYVDEWNTGKNFFAISAAITRALRANERFLPFALLTESGPSNPRFATFKRQHDRALDRFLPRPTATRIELPPLKGRLRGKEYFFWSEHDRMAGLRKLQVTGSILGNLIAAARLLCDSPPLLETVRRQICELSPGDDRAKQMHEAASDETSFSAQFRASAEALFANEQTVGTPTHLPLAANEEEFIGHLVAAGDAILRRARELGADLAVNVCTYFESTNATIDPVNRYYLQQEAAEFVPLTGAPAYFHQEVLRLLMQALQDAKDRKQ